MATVFFNHTGTTCIDCRQYIANVQPWNRAGGTFDVASAVIFCKRDGRTMCLFANSCGQNADNALVPVRIEQGQPPGQAFQVKRHGSQQILSLGFHVFFDRSPLPVERIKLSGKSQSLVRAACQQAGYTNTHVIQPACSVQARTNNKAKIGRADGFMIPASHFQQRQNTWAGFTLTNSAQALLDKNSVVVIKRNNIGNGAQGDQIEKAAQIWLRVWQASGFAQMLSQRGEHVKHDANAGGIFTEESTSWLIRVNNGVGIRKSFAGKVMIGDNHLYA